MSDNKSTVSELLKKDIEELKKENEELLESKLPFYIKHKKGAIIMTENKLIKNINKLYRGNLQKIQDLKETIRQLDENMKDYEISVREYGELEMSKRFAENELYELQHRNDGIEESRELIITYIYGGDKNEE